MKSIYDVLTDLGISFQEFRHAAANTVEEARDIYAAVPGARVRNVFLRDKKGNRHFLVILPADKPFDPAVVRTKYDTSKLGGAMEYELEKYLGVKPGSVSPFALINDPEHLVEVVVDEDLMKEAQVHFHPPGDNTKSLVITTEDLKKFLNGIGAKWESFLV